MNLEKSITIIALLLEQLIIHKKFKNHKFAKIIIIIALLLSKLIFHEKFKNKK